MRRRKKKIKIRRFVRLDIPKELRHYERILRHTYNILATKRDRKKQFYRYDIYKTKQASRAAIKFLELAKELKNHNIDPALYLKIMSRYGRYREARWMPSPTWLARKKSVEDFKWVIRKERRSYDLRLDYKHEIDGWSVFDIYAAIRDSSSMFRDAVDKAGLHPDQATVMLKKDLSPWFMATSLLVSKDGKDFLRCLDLLRRDKHLKKQAIKALNRK